MAIKKIYYNGAEFAPLVPNETQQKAIDSGITAEKVTGYDGLQEKIDKKQNALNRTITLKGDVTGSVTDTGSNLEITTSQSDNTLQDVITAGNTSNKGMTITKDAVFTIVDPGSIRIEDSTGNSVNFAPGQFRIKSDGPDFFSIVLKNGITISASDDVSEAFRDWIGSLPQTNDIKGVGYFESKEAAANAPQNILAFYPESE